MVSPSQALRTGDGLFIEDVQVDFCPGGALPIVEGDRVVPVLNRWIEEAVSRRIPVYFSRDWHPVRHVSFRDQGGDWPPHCIQDTPGARFHPDLLVPDGVVLVTKGVRLDKDQLSSFEDTGLEAQLRRDGVRHLWVGGLALDVCVRATVLDAAKIMGQVTVILDGSRPVDPKAEERVCEEMKKAGARIETTG